MTVNQSPAEHVAAPVELAVRRIYVIRSRPVMLDTHLAELYGVPTFRLNEAVKRNSNRFPEDFLFQLTAEEAQSLTSQFAMSKPPGRGGRRTLLYAFTEHGVAMLSSVLNSERAVQMNIFIIRAFVKLRQVLATNTALAQRIEQPGLSIFWVMTPKAIVRQPALCSLLFGQTVVGKVRSCHLLLTVLTRTALKTSTGLSRRFP
jgi:hypothetical protein